MNTRDRIGRFTAHERSPAEGGLVVAEEDAPEGLGALTSEDMDEIAAWYEDHPSAQAVPSAWPDEDETPF